MDEIIANAPGTKDLKDDELGVRQKIISLTKKCFETMDAVEMDTPVIELKGIVDQLYGEEFNKLVYKIENSKDSSSEANLILRYDLTVPLSRYCAMTSTRALRRYQVGKVYRRDNPNVKSGRMREFYQCDFDIVGDDGGSGINNIEILELMVRILDKLVGRNKYKIKINHRQLLVDVLLTIGLSNDPVKICAVCSIIDKMDKHNNKEIEEMLLTKNKEIGLFDNELKFMEMFNQLFFTNINKSFDDELKDLLKYTNNNVVDPFYNLFKMLKLLKIDDVFIFDLKLARGMDYYTGIIYEAVYVDREIMPSSIAAGGRYDNMIGKLGNHANIPAIGLSIGVERIARIIESTNKNFYKANNPQVFVAHLGTDDKLLMQRIKFCTELRKYGIMATMANKTHSNMKANFETIFGKNIPYLVIIGENEIKNNQVVVKDISKKSQTTLDWDEAIQFFVNFHKIENNII